MLSVAILAAGKGTRMESSLPKVLHKISGKSLLERVIDSCVELKPDQIFVITGHKSKEVQKSIPKDKKINFVIQEPQSGTGHAIQVLCKEVKKHEGKLLVLNGDVPLIRPSTLKRLLYLHDSKNADVSLITTKKTNPHGYGRVFLKGSFIERIVEEKDCNDLERENPLINAGVYCFNWGNLSEIINTLQSNNNQKEIYLTDTISLLKNSSSLEVEDNGELQGINNRIQLSECEECIQNSIKEKHMLNGYLKLPEVKRNKFEVVIDPGHGGPDPGAIGIGGIRETDVVLEVSKIVKNLLSEKGVKVRLTRTNDVDLDLPPRVSIANNTDADIFVSIHANASRGKRRDINGLETFYYRGWRGRLLAKRIQKQILRVSPGSPDRGVKQGRFYVIKNTRMPAVLVEIGFLTGRLDARRLEKINHRKRLAYAIAKGILEYLDKVG